MEALREVAIPPDAAVYFPPARGRYEAKAGLSPLGTEMGNGAVDGQVFQFDSGFDEYRRAKLQARSERPGMVTTMIEKGPFVRFSWGISTDTRLNHHPQPPPGVEPEAWSGRSFDPKNPRLYMRIERQVLYGFPEENGALFVIRTHFRDCEEIRRDAALGPKLTGAVESMSPEALDYKGLAESRDDILEWLRSV